MHASTDALVQGAAIAAQGAWRPQASASEVLAVLVSCVGRKLVMGGRVDEEIEATAEVFSPSTTLTGFYAYGEIGPLGSLADCKLHNQTMTITCLSESV
jgi:small ligand-binding sensory domain FIST